MSNNSALHKSRRYRRSFSENESSLSAWKVGVAVGVIAMCFAMLYPSVFHPLVSSYFFHSPAPKTISNRPPIHPSMNPSRAHPNIHPGMRLSTGQPEISTSSSSKGMFAWMLPIYTVGVVAFLIYTLVKSKKKKCGHVRDYYTTESESEEDCDPTDDVQSSGINRIGRKKLKSLQERLKQTEAAMEKILEQLNAVSVESVQNKKQETIRNGGNTAAEKDGRTEQYLRDLEQALGVERVSFETFERGVRRSYQYPVHQKRALIYPRLKLFTTDVQKFKTKVIRRDPKTSTVYQKGGELNR